MYSGHSDRIPPTSYLSRMFSVIQHGGMRFLVLDCPTESTLPSVLKILAKENVTDVVRVCEPTYATATLNAVGIQVHDLAFKDGGTPPHAVLHAFMRLVEERFNPAYARREPARVPGATGVAAPAAGEPTASHPSPPRSRPASLHSGSDVAGVAAGTSSAASAGHAPHDSGTGAALVVGSSPASPAPPRTIAVHCVAGLGRAPALIAVALVEHGMKPLDAIEYVRARRRGAFNTQQLKYLDSYKPQFQQLVNGNDAALLAATGNAGGKGDGARAGSGRGSARARASAAVAGLFGGGGGRKSKDSPDRAASGAATPVPVTAGQQSSSLPSVHAPGADALVPPGAGARRASTGGVSVGRAASPAGSASSTGSSASWLAKLGKLVGSGGGSKRRSHSALVPPAGQ